jgi:hypothetical protein
LVIPSLLGVVVIVFFFALVFFSLCGPFSLKGAHGLSLRHYEKPLVWFVTLWGLRLVLVNINARKRGPAKEGSVGALDLSSFDERKWRYICALTLVATLVNWEHFHPTVAVHGYPDYLNFIDFHPTKSLTVNLLLNKGTAILLAMAIYLSCKEFVGQTAGVVAALLCIFYPLNNNNIGVFAAENIFVAGCLFAFYLSAKVIEKNGATTGLLMGVLLTCLALHPVGHFVVAVVLLLFAAMGGFRSAGRKRVFLALATPVVASAVWYAALGKPMMEGIGWKFAIHSSAGTSGMLTQYAELIGRVVPYPLALWVMIAGLGLALLPWMWRPAHDSTRRRLLIGGCLLLFVGLTWSALSASQMYLNYVALLMPFWYVFSAVGVAWLLTCRIFSTETLDRNISILLAIFLLMLLVSHDRQDGVIITRQHYSLWDVGKNKELGEIIEDAQAESGYSFAIPQGNEEGCAISGPNQVFFPGKYRCVFRLKVRPTEAKTAGNLGREVGRLEVVAVDGGLALASLVLRAEQMAPPSAYADYPLDFELTSAERIAFRVWTKARVGLSFDSVKVLKR